MAWLNKAAFMKAIPEINVSKVRLYVLSLLKVYDIVFTKIEVEDDSLMFCGSNKRINLHQLFTTLNVANFF